MKKRLLVVLFLSISFFSFAEDKFQVSSIEDDQGKACLIAMGKYRREVKSKCSKLKKTVDWESFVASECIKEKLSQKKFKAIFKLTYNCI